MGQKDIIRFTSSDYPEPEPMTEREILDQYQRAFTCVNQKCFNSELPPIEIYCPQYVLSDPETQNNCLACFYFDDSHKKPPVILLQFDTAPEYGISTDDINDLFHEMIHYFCYLHNINDCDGEEFNYHNLKFKEAAEAHGAICNYTDEIMGHCDARLPDKTLWAIFDDL